MATTVAQLMVKVGADTSEAQQALGSLGTMMAKTGPLAIGGALLAAAVVGVGVASTKMAGDFQAGLTTLVTGAGESGATGTMRKLHDSILKMAVDTGESTKQLVAGMFMIDSAGFTVAKGGLKVLQASAEGAKVGNADLGTVADAVTTILKDYGLGADKAAMATNLLVSVVQHGKTHMEDLAGSLSTVLPAASKFGVSLNDVAGALATMTGAGVPAANATTYLRQLLVSLAAPTSAGEKALKSVGLTTQEVSDMMKKSLPATLQMITDAINRTFPPGSVAAATAFKEIAGGSRQMQGMLDLTGTSMKVFKDNVAAVSDQVSKGGNSIIGWTMVQGTFNEQVSRAKAAVEVLMISLGEHLLPVATRLMSFLANGLIPTIQNFISFITGTSTAANVLRPILAVVAIAIAGALVAAFVAWAVAAGAAAVATIAATWPILAIGAAIGVLIAALVWAYKNWGWFRDIVNAVVTNVVIDFHRFGQGIQTLIGFFQGLFNIVGQVIGKIGGFTSAVGGAVSAAGSFGGGILSHLPHFASGGIISSPTVALVGESGPEAIVPLSGSRGVGGGGGSGLPMTLVLQVDGRTLAQVVTKYQPGVIRQGTGVRSF